MKVHVAVPVVFTGAIVAAAYFSQNALRNRPGAFREGDEARSTPLQRMCEDALDAAYSKTLKDWGLDEATCVRVYSNRGSLSASRVQ